MKVDESTPVIFFDGVCNLCNRSVQFVIKHDKQAKFRFASLQSNAGQELLKQYHLPQTDFNSFILYDNGKIYTRSAAALLVAKELNGWKWLAAFRIVPRFIRDAVYNVIARNRYRWFGKKDECMIPTPDLKARFLE
ncbi:MAG TPA: thiol-disulfide oxidoreductase DCC family protein [Chitinophagaceae bacterium]|nr:thiol-disulfide oxidoreductase DCC family protein [Chitinophagaceae bacterium]